MKSTPAVFHAPLLSALSTPTGNIATPAVFKNGYYPWAVKTPEASPMCWDKEPSRIGKSEEPVISRELLRSVCEPFFEQMLTALQERLEQQQKQKREELLLVRTTEAPSQQLNFLPLQRLDPMPDDESTDVEEVGAFASLLSGPSSSPSTSEKSDVAVAVKQEADQSSEQDPEKSVMVCRHWKTKGWCRLEANCKFQHPEHKRGVSGVPKASGISSTTRGDISGADCPGIRTTLSLTDALNHSGDQEPAPAVFTSTQRKKKTKARSSKRHEEDAPCFSEGVHVPVAAARFKELGIPCSPCIATVQSFGGPGTLLN